MNRFSLNLIIGAALLGLLLIGVGSVFLMGSISTAIEIAEEPVVIEVRQGEGLNQFLHRISEEEKIQTAGLVRLLAIFRGDTRNIKAGEYAFTGRVTHSAFLDVLVSGKARHIPITIQEGLSLKEIGTMLEENQLGSAEKFLALAHDQQFIRSLSLPFGNLRSLEGLVFPETYYFSRGLPLERILKKMVGLYRVRAHEILVQGSRKVGMTPYEALILASVIEKETGKASERPTISAVFHNRLRSGMRLDSDPTVIYGIKDFNGNLTRKHLRTYTEYNTYKIPGLPPTPIASPGLESLKASVNPASVKYLFFVGKGDGSHFFSSDLKTHNRAVWKYQKLPARRKRS